MGEGMTETIIQRAAEAAYPSGEFSSPSLALAFREAFTRGYQAEPNVTAEQVFPESELTTRAVLAVFRDAFNRGRAAAAELVAA